MSELVKSLDLFSCIGCHAIGFERAGIETAALCESRPMRRAVLKDRFPGIPVHDDVKTFFTSAWDKPDIGSVDIVIGGPPCQQTSVAAAIHGKRTGESLWSYMRAIGVHLDTKWFVVEQPTGNEAWEAEVSDDLSFHGYHTSRVEFSASDIGAPYLRRRVFILACTSMQRLEIAWSAIPSAIAAVKGAADARGDWRPDKLGTLRVDALSAGEMERSESAIRKERIEALGDSNPPHMAEVIGRAIMETLS